MEKKLSHLGSIKNFLPYLIVIVLMLGGEFLFIRFQEKQDLDALQMKEVNTILKAGSGLSDGVTQGMQLIEFLSHDARVIAYTDDRSDINRLAVKRLFGNISFVTALYDQVRILDMTGMEVVRVDYQDEYASPLVVPDQDLQDKSKRGYFPICRDLPKGGIYISQLDLNVENGQVEIPYKPVVRICSPIVDSKGNKQGILILNFNATQMLKQFSALSNHLMLVNMDGYWLVSPNPQDEWSFMFEGDISFINRFPDQWDQISLNEEGQFVDQKGLWTYSTIHPLNDILRKDSQIWHKPYFDDVNVSEIPQYAWKVISFLPENELKKARNQAAIPVIVASTLFNPIALIGIWGFYQRRKLVNQETERIRYLATHDGMTGLFNKAFFEAEIRRLNFGRAYPISIIVIDANNLKRVNDQYGHPEGDKLIRNIGMLVNQTFRNDDIQARIGGDEFAIILIATDLHSCSEILGRFREKIAKFNGKNDTLPVDVAIGFATTQEKENLNEVLKRADILMYEEKKSLKAEKLKNELFT
jgi:diguanylate cyclase (GGDEF)-like protein